MKTYHVHVNNQPHHDDYYHRPATSFPCHLETNGMPDDWRGDNGCKYNVQRIYRIENSEGGTIDWGTCSEFRLFLHLLKLRLQGYRKDERIW